MKEKKENEKETSIAAEPEGRWTPEKKAEFRKHLPEKLNKFGEWFFSEESDKEYLIVNDWDAVLRRRK
ncbi:MAG: hypothetical protein LUI09_02800 [Prevotellaceae bacterium]|nr:hypothetical protein [Prevotellaceae bacterium]